MSSARVIGLIAGGRQFPVLVAEQIRKAGHKLIVAGLQGHVDLERELAENADVFAMLPLGKLSKLFKFFKQNKVQDIIMAGTVNKFRVMDVRHFDLKALGLILSLASKGDAAILDAVTQAFEAEGMRVLSPNDFVPQLLTAEGVLTRRKPTEREWTDLRLGLSVAKSMGKLDIGQCVVLREGIIAAVEALEGTDECIRRGCMYGGNDSVVLKVFKPGQEERVDLPSAGADTIAVMAEGKATVLGLEAGKSLLFDAELAIRAADKAGISIVGITEDMLGDKV